MTVEPSAALMGLRELAASGELDEFCAGHQIRLLVVFGSAVGRGPVATSDLDLAVLRRPQADIVRVTTALIRLTGCDRVDVLDLGRAGLVARANALAEGEPLFEDEAGLFARHQMAAVPLLAETGWIREVQLQQLAS